LRGISKMLADSPASAWRFRRQGRGFSASLSRLWRDGGSARGGESPRPDNEMRASACGCSHFFSPRWSRPIPWSVCGKGRQATSPVVLGFKNIGVYCPTRVRSCVCQEICPIALGVLLKKVSYLFACT
jgi:hypothetical protein